LVFSEFLSNACAGKKKKLPRSFFWDSVVQSYSLLDSLRLCLSKKEKKKKKERQFAITKRAR
jgi:hypothetical protein